MYITWQTHSILLPDTFSIYLYRNLNLKYTGSTRGKSEKSFTRKWQSMWAKDPFWFWKSKTWIPVVAQKGLIILKQCFKRNRTHRRCFGSGMSSHQTVGSSGKKNSSVVAVTTYFRMVSLSLKAKKICIVFKYFFFRFSTDCKLFFKI